MVFRIYHVRSLRHIFYLPKWLLVIIYNIGVDFNPIIMFVYIQTINYMFLISYVYKLDLFESAAHLIFLVNCIIESLSSLPSQGSGMAAYTAPSRSTWGITLDVLLFFPIASLNHLDSFLFVFIYSEYPTTTVILL